MRVSWEFNIYNLFGLINMGVIFSKHDVNIICG